MQTYWLDISCQLNTCAIRGIDAMRIFYLIKEIPFFLCRLVSPTLLLGLFAFLRIGRPIVRFFLRLFRELFREIYKKLMHDTGLAELPQMISNEGLSAGLQLLKRKNRYYRSSTIKFIISLYSWLNKCGLDVSGITKNHCILHFCCWGERYAIKAKNFLLASLLAESNLPYLATQKKVILLIHGDAAAQSVLFSDQLMLKKLSQYAELRFVLIPKKIVKKYNRCDKTSFFRRFDLNSDSSRYYFLGALQATAFRTALQSGASVSFLMSDNLLANNFFKNVYEKLQGGRVAIFTNSIRSNYETLSPHLEKVRDAEQKSLSIPGSLLVDLQVKHMHALAKRLIVADSTKGFNCSAQLIFVDTEGKVTLRSFHYHPVLIDCARIDDRLKLQLDYLPIDNSLMATLFKDEKLFNQQLWVCERACDMAVAELTDTAAETEDLTETFDQETLVGLVVNMLKSAPKTFYAPLNKYFISIRHQFVTEEQENKLAADTPHDEQFISLVQQRLTESF